MRRWLMCGGASVTLSVTLSASAGDPLPPSIEHFARPCVAPGELPRIDARVSPREGVTGAHVAFRAGNSPHWYSVEMRGAEGVWSATLPRPTKGTVRFDYILVVKGEGGESRLPTAKALVVAVTSQCSSALPSGSEGPEQVGLVGSAPPEIAGFDGGSVRGFVEGVSIPEPATIPTPAQGLVDWAIPAEGKVRIRTVSPMSVEGTVLREDRDSVTVRLGETEETATLAKGVWLQGHIVSTDEQGLVLAVDNGAPVRVRSRDVVAFESRKPASAIRGILGGLGGAYLGLAMSALLFHGPDGYVDGLPYFGCAAAGALGGAILGGRGSWRPVPLLGSRRVSLAVKPVPRGVSVGVRVGI